jgi:hypothetical protein
VNNLKSSPSPTSGYDFPSAAKSSWNEMLNVVQDLEVKNGLLGLEQNIYLSIVKFLNSSIVRRV